MRSMNIQKRHFWKEAARQQWGGAAHRRARGLLPQTPEVQGEEEEEMKQEKGSRARLEGRWRQQRSTEVESWEGTGTEERGRGWSETAMGPSGWFLSGLQDNRGHPWTHPHSQHFRPDVTSLSLQTSPCQSSFLSLPQQRILSYHLLLETADGNVHDTDNSACTMGLSGLALQPCLSSTLLKAQTSSSLPVFASAVPPTWSTPFTHPAKLWPLTILVPYAPQGLKNLSLAGRE